MSNDKDNVNGGGDQDKNLDDANKNANADDANANKDGDGKEISIPKHRFDEVSKELKAMKEAEAKRLKAEEEANKKKLEEEGKKDELLELQKKETERLKAQLTTQRKVDAIKTEAIKLGATNPDVVVKVLDLDSIAISEEGIVDTSAVSESLGKLKESDAYLFTGQPKVNIGGDGGAPAGGDTTVKKFKRSQLADVDFYNANKDDIQKALKTGNIINDVD